MFSKIFRFSPTFLYIALVCSLFDHQLIDAWSFDFITEPFTTGMNSIFSVVSSSICLVRYRDRFHSCDSFLDSWNERKIDENSIKSFCCAFWKFRQCIDTTALILCKNEAESISDSIADRISQSIYPNHCHNYFFLFDCLCPFVSSLIVISSSICAFVLIFSTFFFIKHHNQ
ncbi:hypothetical protein NH340_JMT07875 [Sarcoptes scabiei]|nr:hypothetical protein NH340_JMT07875 [Sarcoptes scabiei]